MAFVNCPNTKEMQNLFVCQYKSAIYYQVVGLIPPRAEMYVYYGQWYAKSLGVNPFKNCGLGLKTNSVSSEATVRELTY